MSSSFLRRHIGISDHDKNEMLKAIGASSLDQLIQETIPSSILSNKKLNLPEALSEFEYLQMMKSIASKNKVFHSFIGMGYYNTITPSVILRNIFENPGWYTQYTPYQAEIAQGRLEMLLNYQTMVSDLTGLPVSNASLLDEGTAAAEAMTLLFHANGKEDTKNIFLVADSCFPQTIDILKTRATPLGIELVISSPEKFQFSEKVFGCIVQYPDGFGNVNDYSSLIAEANKHGVKVVMATDLLALTLLKSPGELGADVAVGSAQRFGVPLGFGGPHAAFFAAKDEYKRLMPGRIIGVSIDAQGQPAYRMSLQTREQHIRREKATSNICTAQALLANMAAAYAIYHGAEGVKNIAEKISSLTRALADGIEKTAKVFEVIHQNYFDTLFVKVPRSETLKVLAESVGINFRIIDDRHIGISLDETSTEKDVNDILLLFSKACEGVVVKATISSDLKNIPVSLKRNSAYLTHPVFNRHHSESQMMRYLKQLENKDLSLNTSMISLGSCTMKLNAATEMIPVSWPEFSSIHPFAPSNQTKGYAQIISELENYLCAITGFDACSLQPNSGAQGEYAGLLVIMAYHKAHNEGHRNVALIPSSAHGTNPASAVLAGMKVVVTKCDEKGNIDLNDLRARAEEHKNDLACLMVTYPSTHGVFEESIKEICEIIHSQGGLVYMDGANMNAQVGLTSPSSIGADVNHINLHKTFAIPHGGGGPGMGPICVNKKLAPYLPGHAVVKTGGENAIHSVSAAPWGSASILLISYGYIRMLGADGCADATRYAILNANYMKSKLEKEYSILYQGTNGRCAHEMIVDMREFKKFGVEVEDVAKRLMDYGFHAPTVSFPVPGTMMIEPTESEDREELDRFCNAMLSIRKEIQEVADGVADKEDNLLHNAPHTAGVVTADEWNHSYSRTRAAYPLAYLTKNKFWASVSRINNTAGDRNLICV
ncbi:MAG TPA: glycine dehydrogenase (aminomethyl-transferring), partial [Bacteroidetes bacterium]|nr:glycine dehydrogenase (aminomethyl-transferring) [Bacteroidota bacterium]